MAEPKAKRRNSTQPYKYFKDTLQTLPSRPDKQRRLEQLIAKKLSTSNHPTSIGTGNDAGCTNNASIPSDLPRMKEVNDREGSCRLNNRTNCYEYPEYIRPLFVTLCYQGLRLSEALRLRRQHVNFETKKMLIEKTKPASAGFCQSIHEP